ncbi:MAG: aminotransferase class V-fold PLP-dependent enzyme [Spirochaetes bacterium]|nr:aminotransferase class V-fold PLP-dependent enzyme [Spirochaetota bacterium]
MLTGTATGGKEAPARAMIYLDWAASAPPEPSALAAVTATAASHANPSSPHPAGRAAAAALENARRRICALLGGGEIVFTSGATESNSLLLLSVLDRARSTPDRRPVVVVSGIEHASVHDQAERLASLGAACRVVSAGPDGRVRPGDVARAVDRDTAVVSVMLVNNETGVVQPVAEIAGAVRAAAGERRVVVHTDAVQAFGKLPFAPGALGVDAASVSAHKVGGPRGIGALWLRGGLTLPVLAAGGGQERGMRPGTENVAGAAGFAAAAEVRCALLAADAVRARDLAARLVRGLAAVPGAQLFPASRADGESDLFSPWIVCFGFPPLPGEVVVRLAGERGICIASGSACSSRKKIRTRVLEAMGHDRRTALSAVRVSTGPSTSGADIDALLDFLRTDLSRHYAAAVGGSAAVGSTAAPGGAR